MNSKLPFIFAGLSLIVAAIAIGVAGQTMIDVRNLDIPEPVEKFDWKETGEGTLIAFINKNYISEGEFQAHNIILNNTLKAVIRDLEGAGLAIDTLQNRFIIIEHQGDIPGTSPVSTAKCAGNFSLETIDLTGNDAVEFAKIQTVFIKGNYDGVGEPYSYKVKETGKTAVLKEGSGTIAADGSLLGVFNEATNQDVGDYTAEVKIRGITDCITFKIVP